MEFLRKPILKNISERLLLKIFSETLSMSKSHNMVILQRMNELILLISEAVVQSCTVKNMFLEISQNSQERTCARVSFLIQLQSSNLLLYLKKTLAQVFSCQFYEISKNTFFTEHPWWQLLSDFSLFRIQIYL